jgi:N-acetylneuraminate lyase
MKVEKIKGLIAAPFTPMKENGDINPALIKEYASKLKKDGLSGVFVCGTTGEGMFMTLDERKQVAAEWVNEQTDNFKVIVHVGTTSARQSKELAKHAQAIGAYGTGAMGPVFLQPSSIDNLVTFCAEIAVGAPDLPFFYYHIPSVSGINLSMSEFIRSARAKIPNLAGIKFTDNNFYEMQKCLNMDDKKWNVFHGFDEMLLAGLSLGVEGGVGSTYNFMAPLYLEIINAFQAGNLEEAKRLQLEMVKRVEVLLKYGGPIVAGKALMKEIGIDCGECRAPLPKLPENQYEELIKEMNELGLFER